MTKFVFQTHFANLNHLGTFPAADVVDALEAMKFLGTLGFDAFDAEPDASPSVTCLSSRFLSPKTFFAPAPVDSFWRNSSLMRFESVFCSQPKCKSAEGTQFDSIRV